MTNFHFGLLAALIFLIGVPAAASNAGGHRTRFTINDNWRFSASDRPNAEKVGVDVSSWERVDLPHNWNTQDAFDDEPGFRRGASWYRKELSIESTLNGKQIFIYFEGANQVADVFVNERHIGSHVGGYSAFVFDVTDVVKFDAPNILAVRVDNSFNQDIPPLTADFTFWGGIYRDVWLIVADKVHVKVTDHASSGIQITTPGLAASGGRVNVRGTAVNSDEKARSFEVVNAILDAGGREVISSRSKLDVGARSEKTFDHTTGLITSPRLWSPDSPYLYSVRTRIVENGRTLDETSNPLGFRWFSFDAAKGFSLNGRPLRLRGTNRHQDHYGFGNAVPDELHVHDMELMKSTGYNFVRLAHYPQDPAILAAADRLGLLLWEETPIVNYITPSKAFAENSARMVREMIRQHRNHPSMLMWGYMNEIFLRLPRENEADIKKATVQLAKELNRIAKAEDPTRPTAIAFHGNEIYNTEGIGDIADITGWNLYNGWYSNAFEDFGKFIDDQHKRYPDRVLFISEYGANSDLRLHSLSPRRFDSTTEYQRMFHESHLEQMMGRPFLAGWTIWNEFDFAAEQRGENMPHVNNKGMFTYDRRTKDVHFFYKANYAKTPVLHIAARDWPHRAGTEPNPHPIDVYSNTREIELFLNGVSLGKKKPNAIAKSTWQVTFSEGVNVLSAEGWRGQERITDRAEVSYRSVTPLSDEIAINAGSNVQFVAIPGSIWLEDTAYRAGGFGFTGTGSTPMYAHPNDRNILGTHEDPVFQTRREGAFSYRFDLGPGHYELELRFAETRFEKEGERIFDVTVNGTTVIKGLDLVREVGPRRAYTRRFEVDPGNGGVIVEFNPVKGAATVSGLRIRRISGYPSAVLN